MRLYEFEGKQLFNKSKIPVPDGHLAGSADEVYKLAAKLERPVAIKAQVLTGGRGKAGGIRLPTAPTRRAPKPTSCSV